MNTIPSKYKLGWFPKATDVKVESDYKIRVTFDDGKVKIYDYNNKLDIGLWTKLKDKDIFNSVRIVDDVVTWVIDNDGQEFILDHDPVTLYVDSVEI